MTNGTILLAAIPALLTGCAYSIADIDVTKTAPVCTRCAALGMSDLPARF